MVFFTIGIPTNIINSTVIIYNILGQEIGRYNLNSTSTTINIQGISFGVYVYKIETVNGKQVSGGKFLVY
jgi:hypothetical protein